MEKHEILMKEYELCQASTHHLESTIWKTSAGMGVGSLGTMALLAGLKVSDWHVALPIGLLVVSVTWIWWFMATRWWDVEHFTLWRMQDIEEDLGMYQKRYTYFKDGTLSVHDTDLSPKRKRHLLRDERIRRRGVRKAMRFFPPLVSVTWIIYILALYFVTNPPQGG